MILATVLIGILCLIAFFGLARLFGKVCNSYAAEYERIKDDMKCYDRGELRYEYFASMMKKCKTACIVTEKIAMAFGALFYIDAIVVFFATIALIITFI